MSPKEEKTLIILKPDALQRGYLGEIIHRFERKGLRIAGLKMAQLDDVTLEAHYAHIKDKPFFGNVASFMKSAPVILMVLSGINAVSTVRLILGPTKGHEAPAGTIRGDFAISGQTNLVHASDSLESAKTEVSRFFDEKELFNYSRADFPWIYGADER